MSKFTFKTIKPVGKWKSFSNDEHVILQDKLRIGLIGHEFPFTIKIMVMKTETITDNNPNCVWKWIALKKESKTLDEAKEFINLHYKILNERYTLHKLEL